MPSDLVKSYARKTGKKVSEVDKLWNRAEEIIKNDYEDVEVGSDRFYKLVNGTLKRMLKLDEEYQNIKRFNKMYEDALKRISKQKDEE